MIWTLEPTAPWRVTGARVSADAAAAANVDARVEGDRHANAAFLTRFAPADHPLIETTLLDALRYGESACECTLATARGRLTLTRLRAPSGAPHALLAQWSPAADDAAATEGAIGADAEGPDSIGTVANGAVASGTVSSGTVSIGTVANDAVSSGAVASGAGASNNAAAAPVFDDRALREFIGSISHDLRTPLNGVLGMSRLLMDSGLRADQIEHARAIDASAEQLLTAIEDLLEFATLDRETALHPADVDPRQLVEDVIASLSARAAEREIDVCALVSANVPEMVYVDPARLSQVLTWLVDDGIGRTLVGDVVIRVTMEGRDDDVDEDTRLRCEVVIEDAAVDDGVWPAAEFAGIAPPRGGAGTGAGAGAVAGAGAGAEASSFTSARRPAESPAAVVCRRLVALMGGTLGTSTTSSSSASWRSRWFTVLTEPRPAPAHAAPHRFVQLAGRRVLCVDDQPVSRRVLLEQLRAWNLSVEMCAEAHGALTMMKVAVSAGVPFELVIIDLRLPGVDGLSLARLIKQDPVLRATKLILLTGYPARGQAVAARQAGIDAYLTKPVREAPLRACLEALFNDEPGDEHARCGEDRHPLRPRVLVADGHPLNQKVAVQLLQKLGCRVDVTADGGDAVDAVQRTPYHLVLLDSRLPSRKAMPPNAQDALRPGHPRRPPVIVLIGEEDEAARAHARESGATDVLTKPLRLNVLREKLAQWIVAAPLG